MQATRPLQDTPVFRSESDLLVFISSVMTKQLEWARDTAVQTFEQFPIAHTWVFERTPASSESATDAYLRKVEEADFVVWLVGSRTTEAVVNEIHTCMAHDRRLLVFKLPAKNRDALTQQLLADVSSYTKWRNVLNRAVLGQELTASISDELVRALRDPAPPARLQKLREWRALSVATCKRSWITLGVPEDLATKLAADQSIGDILVPSDTRVHLVVGDAGAGKSLAASRLLQQAIDRALRDATEPIPFFLNARDLHEPLHEYIDKNSAGIVRPFQQRTLVILDGIDEVGVSQANELLTQIQCYVEANSKTSAVVMTKPLPRLKMIDQHTRVPALDDEDALKLISRIAGRPVELGEMYDWPESMRDAARRPLFAVMIGSELCRRPGLYLERPVQLINRLAQHVVENSHHEGEKVNRLLQELAVNAISTGRRVRKADLTVVQSEHRQLADSLLIDEHDDTIDFTLQILRDWYAARAIVEGTTSIDAILPASDRWMTAFRIVIDSDNRQIGDELRSALASSDPGLASLVMEEATRDWTDENQDPPESALETGERLWQAMTAWGRGLGKLFRVIGPVGADGRTATIGVRSNSRTLTTSWYEGQDELPPVVQLPDRADLRRPSAEWPVLRREMTRQDTNAWAWLTTKDHLVESLSKTIETRRLALPSHDAVRELAWAFALAAKNQARFNPEPVSLQEVLRTADTLGRVITNDTVGVKVAGIGFSLEEFRLVRGYLSTLTERGDTIVIDPWPPFDQMPSGNKRPWHTWDFFSDARLLDRVHVVHAAALQLYKDMLDRWFDRFRSRFRFGRLLPIRLEGYLARSHQPHFEGAPVLEWCARAVPLGDPSSVAFSWETSKELDLFSYWKAEEDNLRQLRPGSDVTPPPIQGDGMKAIDSSRPATDLAHEWLIDDLKELGWTELIMLPPTPKHSWA